MVEKDIDFDSFFEEEEPKKKVTKKRVTKDSTKKTTRKSSERESDLIVALKKDATLAEDEGLKNSMLSMARLYESDLKNNLNKGIFQLAEDYDMHVDDWKDFLTHPIVERYVELLLKTDAISKVSRSIAEGENMDKHLKNWHSLKSMGSATDRSMFIFSRLPAKRFDVVEEQEVEVI